MRRARLALFGVGAALLGGLLVWALVELPGFGHFDGRYGRVLAHSAVPQRGATNSVVVTAFDYRALDTLVEEMILFTAAAGAALLLRSVRQDRPDEGDEGGGQLTGGRAASASMRWLATGLVGPVFVLGAYVVTHGHLTPGGGFQGGVILMAALLTVALGGQLALARRLRRGELIEAVEALGATGFAAIGLAGLVAGTAFLQNVLPIVPSGLSSGGTIGLANVSVGIEVAGAFLVVLAELLAQRAAARDTGG